MSRAAISHRFLLPGLVCALLSSAASADWVQARCDVYPKGEDHTDVVIPCTFSRRQGCISIDGKESCRFPVEVLAGD